MATGHRVGTLFAEIGLDYEPYTRAQKTLLKDATSTTTNIEKNFKNLGIKSAAEFDLMRAKISNSYNMITHSGKASADDILRAEKAKNDQLNKINDQQFGHQTSLIESIKKNWLAYSAGIVATFYAINKAVDFIGTLTAAASDLQETQSKSNAVFGASAAAITAWSKNSATAFGMSRQAALESASSIGNMFKQLGAGETTAAKTSKQMVELSADLASFHNVAGGATEVLNAMQSAFRGQYEPIQRYIPTINAAAVEQMALATTGKAATSELTRLEKAAAAQAIIMRDAGDAVGDFAKTSGGLANQQRILQANVTDLKAAIGESLLPVAEKIVKEMNNWVGANKDLIGQKVTDTVDAITRAVKATAEAYEMVNSTLRVMRLLMNMPMPNDMKRLLETAPPLMTGKIGPATPGYNLYTGERISNLPLEMISAAPAAVSTMKTEEMLKLNLRAYERYNSQLEKENAEYFKWEDKQRDDASAKSIRDTEEILKINLKASEKYYSNLEKENAEYFKWEDDQKKASAKKTAEEIAAELTLKEKLLKSLGVQNKAYFAFEKTLLDTHFGDMKKTYKDKADMIEIINAAELQANKKLRREETLLSNDFFAGIKVGYEQSLENTTTFAQMGKDVFESFTAETSSMLSDNFFNIFTGRMDELTLDWESMWQGMARTASDRLAEIATQKALDVAISGVDWLGGAMGWWAAGAWDIKKDQMAVLHKGEMVIPAGEAGRIRDVEDQAALGEAWEPGPGTAGGSAAARSLGASARGWGAAKLAGLFLTGTFVPTIAPLAMLSIMGKALYEGLRAEQMQQSFEQFARDMQPYADAALSSAISGTEVDWGEFGASGLAESMGLGGGEGEGDEGWRFGGIARGPRSGYRAILHDTEAIVPLPNGRSIPVEMKGKGVNVTFNIGGNLIGDKQTFNDFAEQIDYVISKKNKRVYQ